MSFHEGYQEAVLGWPGGGLRTAEFAADPEGSRRKINSEVEDVTRGLVTDLVPSGVIDASTAAVIVNALYLKVAWRNAFATAETAPAPFHAPTGVRDVATMQQVESLPYAASAGWQMVTLPTESDVVVDVLLPDDTDTVLTADAVAALHDSTSTRRVELRLPRFRVEANEELNGPLAQLGVVSAFSDRFADFRGIADTDLVVKAVLHKAVLDVDEQGFEGAAATAVLVQLTSMDLSRPLPFHVDRPFHLLIRHRRSGAIYFIARVEQP
jgi:serpin B